MTSLTSLIERIEAATGPDQELDRLVHYHLAVVKSDRFTEQSWIDLAKKQNWNAPHYSTSIDAALTLLPDGYDWIIGNVNGHYGGTPYACVGSTEQHYAATPALALVAAILRARQTEPHHDES